MLVSFSVRCVTNGSVVTFCLLVKLSYFCLFVRENKTHGVYASWFVWCLVFPSDFRMKPYGERLRRGAIFGKINFPMGNQGLSEPHIIMSIFGKIKLSMGHQSLTEPHIIKLMHPNSGWNHFSIQFKADAGLGSS